MHRLHQKYHESWGKQYENLNRSNLEYCDLQGIFLQLNILILGNLLPCHHSSKTPHALHQNRHKAQQ